MERAIVEYLANALWQVPLLVAGVAGLLWALGADVRTRHRAWLAVLAVAMVLPLRGMEMTRPVKPAFAVSREVSPWTAAVVPAETVAEAPLPAVERRKPMLVFGEVSGRWLVRFYIAAVLFFAWRILRSWIAAQALLRRSRSIDLAPRAMAIFAQAADAAAVPLPRLRQSDETVSPVVIGAVRPVLLLPAGFDRLKDDEILAALSHEFAHLARRDYLVNLLCQLGALPLAWHPAIAFVQKRIRDTREMLCDAAAAQEMASPVRYATCLVAFALRALDGHDAALATQGLSMFDNRILEERILQLTQAPERPEASTRLARLAGAVAGLVLAVAMALLFHITPTWADTPVGPNAEPVQLTPQVDLPAIPAPSPAPAPAAKPKPAPRPHPVVVADDDTRRAIAEEERERARRKNDEAQRKNDEVQRRNDAVQRENDEVQRQRDEAQRQRDAARAEADRQREAVRQQREEAQQQREAAREEVRRQRELAQEQREQEHEMAEQQRDEARQAMEEARRSAAEASRVYAAEVRRQVAEAVKASQSVNSIDMEKIKQEIAQATAAVHSPEFKSQMAELQAHMQQLHDNMAELHAQMRTLNHEIEKSVNAPM